MLHLSGDLDLPVRDKLARALTRAAQYTLWHTIVVDLSDVTFLEAAALSALLTGFTAVLRAGRQFHLTGSKGIVKRVLAIVGLANFQTDP